MTRKHDDTPQEAVERARRRIALEGLDAGVTALLDVCRNEKAQASAKAAAGAALLRAGGFYADKGADGSGKELHEMDGNELSAAIARGQKQLETVQRQLADESDGDEETPDDAFEADDVFS